MLEKPIFDCTNLGDFYDCGCEDDEKNGSTSKSKAEKKIDTAAYELEESNPSVEITKEP